jgi:hypothetical protein
LVYWGEQDVRSHRREKVKELVAAIVVGMFVIASLPIEDPTIGEGVETGIREGQGGNVYYMMPTHHVESLEESNVAKSVLNAIYYFVDDGVPIDVLVYSNVLDRGDAIMDYFIAHADIISTLTLDDSDLLSLEIYDVVIIHSNGAKFSPTVEQSVKDYLDSGGNLIGSHDLIWAQFNNPIIEEVFGATAIGDGSNPGQGWFHGDFDVCIVPGHPIAKGLDNCWRLHDDDFYFDLDFKKEITVVWETSWQGQMIPVAWTISATPEEIEADMRCHPRSLNDWSMGNWITCYIELPAGYDPRDIDADTILFNGILKPELDPKYSFVTDESEYIADYDNDNIPERMVKFDRAEVQAILPLEVFAGILITGFLEDGTEFEGSDGVRHFVPMAVRL